MGFRLVRVVEESKYGLYVINTGASNPVVDSIITTSSYYLNSNHDL